MSARRCEIVVIDSKLGRTKGTNLWSYLSFAPSPLKQQTSWRRTACARKAQPIQMSDYATSLLSRRILNRGRDHADSDHLRRLDGGCSAKRVHYRECDGRANCRRCASSAISPVLGAIYLCMRARLGVHT
jgi:hypothetical protein